jgi:general secretion pathway protein A
VSQNVAIGMSGDLLNLRESHFCSAKLCCPMYKTFFNLTRHPFELTPDPLFLFPTERHNEALAALYCGVRRHKGFVVLTGEVGTGKTLLLRCLFQSLTRSKDVAYAYLFNSRLSSTEFLQYVVSDFGLPASGKNKSELLLELGHYVVSRGLSKLTTVLVVDEAHHLSADVLEEIRLLTNLETAEDKLLQILLVGQPELDQKLDSPALRQLKQRIALRSHLEPLNPRQTKEYVEWRLHRAGANSGATSLFPEQTIAAVHHHSRGSPRLINIICENALLAAYAKHTHSVTPDMVNDVAKDFRLEMAQSTDVSGDREIEEADVRRAAKLLLDFYASHKSVVRGADLPPVAGASQP